MNFVQNLIMKRAKDRGLVKKFDNFSSGDTVNVFTRVKEGEKERVQVYRGIVIKIQGKGLSKCFTVRKMSSGIGVERTFPFAGTKIEKVEIVNSGKVRQSRLYYLRDLRGRAARLKSQIIVPEDKVDASGADDVAQAAPVEKKSAKKSAK